MPRTLLFVSSLLALGGIHTFSNAAELRSHSRDLQKRAEVHCGTWEIQCGGGGGGAIEDVCNNACYFQNYIRNVDDGEYTATYRKGVDPVHNQIHSGCQIDGKSVCRLMPFSQKMADAFKLEDPSCEQFPMADWAQDDFENGKGIPRNTLRCVEQTQSAAVGAQWQAFRDATGHHPKRACDGPMNQDNTDYKFTIEMNFDEADPARLGYCHFDPPQGPPIRDPGEFWLDTLAFPNGANNFPLTKTDNVYLTGATWDGNFQTDVIGQCKLQLKRTEGNQYNVSLYDATTNQMLSNGYQALVNDGDKLVLDPTDWKRYPKLIVISKGPWDEGGESPIEFIASHTENGDNPLTDFSFSTESQGEDPRFKVSPDPEKGLYCDVGPVQEDVEETLILNMHMRLVTCHFPCTLL